MSDAIPRHLTDRNDWTVADFDHYQRTGELPPNPEWIRHKAAALDESAGKPTSVSEMSPEDHAERKYGGGR